jgi:hypothetical protein
MSHEVYVVVESSRAGETVVGAFSTLEKARAVVPRGDAKRLEDYRVEFHVIDQPVEEEQAWTVVMSRDGDEIDVAPVILCSCGDDYDRLENSSYIEAGGGPLHVVVWARTKGSALDAAGRYRDWLVAEQIWRIDEVQVPPISAQHFSKPGPSRSKNRAS